VERPDRLDPVVALEGGVQDQPHADHQADRHGIAEDPVELGHGVEIHSVDGANEGGREEDRAQDKILLTCSLCAKLDSVRRRISSGECTTKPLRMQKTPGIPGVFSRGDGGI